MKKTINAKLHHFAYNIKPNTLEKFLEIFELLWCTLSYREWEKRWCMIEQKSLKIDIQIIETENKNINIDEKIKSHIAFLSNSPKKDIENIEKFAVENKLNFRKWGWNDKEFWFDFSDIFNNFVVEIMHTSVVE